MKHGDRVKQTILDAALDLWRDNPTAVTPSNIADRTNVTKFVVLYHFKSVDGLRNAAAEYAVEKGESRIIVQLIATKHPAVNKLSKKQKDVHLRVMQTI